MKCALCSADAVGGTNYCGAHQPEPTKLHRGDIIGDLKKNTNDRIEDSRTPKRN